MKLSNIALIPDPQEWDLFFRASTLLKQRFDSRFLLSKSSIPHVTLLQVEWDRSQEDLNRRVAPFKNDVTELDLLGLCFLPGRHGEVWIEIPVKKTSGLTQLQMALLSAVEVSFPRIKNGVGDNYRPHLTLGLIDNGRTICLEEFEYSLLRKRGLKCALELGLSGPSFEFVPGPPYE